MASDKVEEQLAQRLTEGEMNAEDAEEAARRRLPVKTEIRIQAEIDPVVEETRRYRKMASEVDDRYAQYDRFVDRPRKASEQE
ncbi:hypothetical protein [Paenibacillus xerothermodurans]|uniref:Uncharacterized protein n=1 Tax=Paenibacillus xerothermodurans TaxID=1977292 RepID=A0A2W1NXA4_PAEXE|nr:hypothetical protein [Paenibacillus xerothermodurans]PZE19488.1 hypothetical protein CBW46_018295 [Paenibacillus xerothermodurans]